MLFGELLFYSDWRYSIIKIVSMPVLVLAKTEKGIAKDVTIH